MTAIAIDAGIFARRHAFIHTDGGYCAAYSDAQLCAAQRRIQGPPPTACNPMAQHQQTSGTTPEKSLRAPGLARRAATRKGASRARAGGCVRLAPSPSPAGGRPLRRHVGQRQANIRSSLLRTGDRPWPSNLRAQVKAYCPSCGPRGTELDMRSRQHKRLLDSKAWHRRQVFA